MSLVEISGCGGETEIFEGDRLVSGCPSGLANPSNKFISQFQ
jgi:hypothetical protein